MLAGRQGLAPTRGSGGEQSGQTLQVKGLQQRMALVGIQSVVLADHLHLEAVGHQQGAGLAALLHQGPPLNRTAAAAKLAAGLRGAGGIRDGQQGQGGTALFQLGFTEAALLLGEDQLLAGLGGGKQAVEG
jgi:hypothetical protein